jgi:hypothetical protein
MSESASVEVLRAEIRVLQVGNGQITLSMYRQLDEATFERFQPFGRVRDNERKHTGKGALQLVGRDTETGALVRCDAQPPDWSASDAPKEFMHWLTHQPEVQRSIGYRDDVEVARRQGFAIVWRRGFNRVCDAPHGWHVKDEIPEWVRQSSYSQRLEENKETRIGQVLRRIMLAFSYSPPLEANKETRIEQGDSLSQWLEANQDTRCTVDLVELEQPGAPRLRPSWPNSLRRRPDTTNPRHYL